MHVKVANFLRNISVVTGFILIAGCHPFVKYPKAPYYHKEAAAGAVGGAGVGAVVAASGSAGLGAGVGAIVGAAAGTYYTSEIRYLKRLKKDGVHVVQIGDHVRIVIPSDRIFALNSATILPRYYPILLDVTQFVENYGTVPITVTAYSDNVGSEVTKLNLTTRQAKSVVAFFWSHGIPYNYLKAIGNGSINPIASNLNPTGSYHNRRVEVTFPIQFGHHGRA